MNTSIIVDTNVVCEIFAMGDLLNESAKHADEAMALADANLRSVQLRTRCSLLLAQFFAERRVATGSLLEFADVLTQRVAPYSHQWSAALTTTIIHRVRDRVFGGWNDRTLAQRRPDLRGTEADDEILRLAGVDGDTIITNEGVTPAGYSDTKGKKLNLRGRARAAGIPVFSPKEFLDRHAIDLDDAAARLVASCEAAADEARRAEELATWDAAHALTTLVQLYRFVLLDEVDASLRGIPRPRIPWFDD